MAEPGLTLDIDLSELEELNKQFPQYTDITIGEIRDAMIGSLIVFEELIKAGTPVGATGNLRQSFARTRRVRRGEKVFTGSVSTPLAHGFPIERGREVGSPISKAGQESIALWIKRTWSDPPPDNKLKGVAFVVARAITKKGFKKKEGYRMVETAFEEGSPKALKLFDSALQKAVVKIEKKIEAIG